MPTRGTHAVTTQPAGFRREVTGIGDLAGDREHTVGGRGARIVDGAAVLPDQRGPERIAGGVDGDAAIELAGDRDRGDVGGARVGGGERTGDRGAERAFPHGWRLLAPKASAARATPYATAMGAEHGERERGVAHDDLEALRADIDSEHAHLAILPEPEPEPEPEPDLYNVA